VVPESRVVEQVLVALVAAVAPGVVIETAHAVGPFPLQLEQNLLVLVKLPSRLGVALLVQSGVVQTVGVEVVAVEELDLIEVTLCIHECLSQRRTSSPNPEARFRLTAAAISVALRAASEHDHLALQLGDTAELAQTAENYQTTPLGHCCYDGRTGRADAHRSHSLPGTKHRSHTGNVNM